MKFVSSRKPMLQLSNSAFAASPSIQRDSAIGANGSQILPICDELQNAGTNGSCIQATSR
jgi:hypothetical protein